LSNSSTDDPSSKDIGPNVSLGAVLVFVRVPLNEASQLTLGGQVPPVFLLEAVPATEPLLKLPEKELLISKKHSPLVCEIGAVCVRVKFPDASTVPAYCTVGAARKVPVIFTPFCVTVRVSVILVCVRLHVSLVFVALTWYAPAKGPPPPPLLLLVLVPPLLVLLPPLELLVLVPPLLELLVLVPPLELLVLVPPVELLALLPPLELPPLELLVLVPPLLVLLPPVELLLELLLVLLPPLLLPDGGEVPVITKFCSCSCHSTVVLAPGRGKSERR